MQVHNLKADPLCLIPIEQDPTQIHFSELIHQAAGAAAAVGYVAAQALKDKSSGSDYDDDDYDDFDW